MSTLEALSIPLAQRLEPVALAQRLVPVLAANSVEVDEEARFPVASLGELRRSGLMGLLVPREYGGFGASTRTMAQVAQVLAAGCPSTAMIWAMHCQQVAVLADHAPEDIRRDVLPRIAAGEIFVASVTTERGKGGHLQTSYSPLRYEGGEAIVQREAPVVTGGAYGDGFLITMCRDEQAPPSEVVLVWADRPQLEVNVRSGWNPLGMRGTHSVGATITGRVPRSQIIDPPGGFIQVAVSSMVPVGHIAWAACWTGAAASAFRQAVALLRDPVKRKGYDLQSDLFLERLAQARLSLDTLSAYLNASIDEYEEMRRLHAPDDPAFAAPAWNIHINTLKLFASETAFRVIDQLIHVLGLRFGYLKNDSTTLERLFRDLRSASLMYANDRLLVANGKLALLDTEVTLL